MCALFVRTTFTGAAYVVEVITTFVTNTVVFVTHDIYVRILHRNIYMSYIVTNTLLLFTNVFFSQFCQAYAFEYYREDSDEIAQI